MTLHCGRTQASSIATRLMSYIIGRELLEAIDSTPLQFRAVRAECLLYMAKPHWTAIRVILIFVLGEQPFESLTESNAVNSSALAKLRSSESPKNSSKFFRR
jgi:hypothetical protein